MTKSSIVLSTNKITFDWSAVLWLVYENVYGHNFVVLSYTCTSVLWKELKWPWSYLTDSYIVFTLKLESRQNFCSNRWIGSCTYGKKNISDFPPCGKMVIVVTEFVIFCKTRPFYEIKWIRRKWLPDGGISKIFFLDLFSPSFLDQKL